MNYGHIIETIFLALFQCIPNKGYIWILNLVPTILKNVMVTHFFNKKIILRAFASHFENSLFFLETLFRFSVLDILKMSIFKNPIDFLKF